MNMEQKVALVTGGTRGIGKAIALKLAESGIKVAVTASRESEDLAEGLRFYKADASSFEEAQAVVKQVLADFGKIDILVNNAGITRDGLLLSMSEEDFDRVLAVNLKGTFNMTKACIRAMIKNRFGRIVNVASVVGIAGNAGQANYAASKAGIIGFTKSVAKEYASRGITCNAVAPGFIATAMTDKMPEEAKQKVLSEIPLGKYGTPEDVAEAVAFLVGDGASYITGEVLKVDGGMCI